MTDRPAFCGCGHSASAHGGALTRCNGDGDPWNRYAPSVPEWVRRAQAGTLPASDRTAER